MEGKTSQKMKMKAKVSKIEYGAKARKKEETRVTGLYDRRTENGKRSMLQVGRLSGWHSVGSMVSDRHSR